MERARRWAQAASPQGLDSETEAGALVVVPQDQRPTKRLQRMSDILARVRKIVIEHLDADPEKVTEKAAFLDDLGADSLDNVELVMAFEEEFDIEIPDDAAEHIQTVGDAVKFISERLGGEPPH